MPEALAATSRESRRASACRGRTRGTASPPCISASTRISRLPSRPPGCRLAKCSSRKPLRCDSAMRQRVAQRERRGRAGRRRQVHRAGFFGDVAAQRRRRTPGRASTAGCPVSEISRAPIRRIASSSRMSSSVSPLYDSATTTSSACTTPRSPCTRFGGVEEDRRRARARQRRGELARDDARLAHAGHDDAAGAAVQQIDARVEVAVRVGESGRESPAPRSRAPGARGRSDRPVVVVGHRRRHREPRRAA